MTTAIELRNQQAANNTIARAGNLEPQSFAEVARLAEYVAKSGLFAVKTTEQAMMVMLTGASLGLSPVAALRGVHVIQGKAALDATLVAGLCQQHPDCEYWRVTENTNERCTIETKRRGSAAPVSRTWTLDDAKRADLLGKGTWKAFPAAMLRARCTTDLARAVYGDALFGVYSPEELESAPREAAAYEAQPAAASVTVVAKPVPAPGDVDAILFAIGQASTVDELKALSKRAAELTTKGTPERQRLSDALQARRREIEGGDGGPKGGGGAPKPEASQGAADARGNGEPVTGEHEPAPSAQAWTPTTWRAHCDAKTNRYELANSYARHEAELEASGVDEASEIAINRLINMGLDETHAVEAIAAACERRDGKKSAGKAA